MLLWKLRSLRFVVSKLESQAKQWHSSIMCLKVCKPCKYVVQVPIRVLVWRHKKANVPIGRYREKEFFLIHFLKLDSGPGQSGLDEAHICWGGESALLSLLIKWWCYSETSHSYIQKYCLTNIWHPVFQSCWQKVYLHDALLWQCQKPKPKINFQKQQEANDL